jgi:VWFA-related protein
MPALGRLLFATALAGLCLAQDAELNSRESAVTFSTGTNLVPVKVVVRNRDGRAIGNLEQSDFRLYDNGKEQVILRFSVDRVEPQTPRLLATPTDVAGRDLLPATPRQAAAIPERFIGYVFDDVHTDIADLMRAREAASRHLEEVIEPSTRVAVFTTSGQTTLDFTDDLAAIRKSLSEIRRWSADDTGTDCPELNYYWADLIVNRNDPQALGAAVDDVKICMHVEDDAMARQIARSMAIAKLSQGQRESRLGLDILNDAVRRMTPMPGTRTIVYVSAGFFIDGTIRLAEADLLDRAIRANVVINSLDARGLYTITPGGGIGHDQRHGRNGQCHRWNVCVE